MKTVEDILIERVTRSQGIKAVELASSFVQDCQEAKLSLEWHDPCAILEHLVASGKLVEVEYVLPGLPFRTKSFYLPAGTQVNVRSE